MIRDLLEKEPRSLMEVGERGSFFLTFMLVTTYTLSSRLRKRCFYGVC